MATDASCNSERASRSRLFRKLFALATAFVAGAVTLIAAQADKTAAIQTGLRLADTYLAQGDLDRAVSEMQRLVDLDPDNIDILYLAQLVYSELADGTLNKLAILAPASARMQQVIAEHLVNSGNLDRAISHYKKCLELDPHLSGVRYELAEALFQNLPSDPTVEAQALAELQTAVKTEGDNSKIECELARIALRQSDREGSLAHYRRALELNPHNPEAQLGLGRMLASDHPQEALKYLRMTVESDPLNGEAHYRLAAVYRKLQRTEEAQKETKLFQEIKLVKAQVAELYREMNKAPPRSIGAQDPDAEPQ